MNVTELIRELDARGIPRHLYSVTGGTPNEAYVISPEPGGLWSVYYANRGLRTGMQIVPSESAACAELLHLLAESRRRA